MIMNSWMVSPVHALVQWKIRRVEELMHIKSHVTKFSRWHGGEEGEHCYKGSPQSPGQPIGVTVHYTQQPIREQSLSSQPSQKLFQTHHPDEAPKPRLPDPIDHPIAVMPPSRM
ncbi:hypothetical protein TNCV_4584141 [Trichonephila clavipes]|nr:hypothetical protein TNCV_4584141 [Trichonephila clavipes]